uniref:Ig-like domain-containing protein n=1 Tax=Cyclopterus lumpus TaxID=8103 RepID=A0A8C3G270_CYCLU
FSTGESVTFTTSVKPPAKPYMALTWSFNGTTNVITSTISWGFKTVNIITSTSTDITADGYGNRISLDRATGALELRNLVMEDSGEYTITITPDAGLQKQGKTTLIVYAPITGAIIRSPEAILIEDKSYTNLSCEASGTISTRVWMKDNQPLHRSGRVTFSVDNKTLSLQPVHSSNHGTLQCRVSNPFSTVTVAHLLTVNCEYEKDLEQIRVLLILCHY